MKYVRTYYSFLVIGICFVFISLGIEAHTSVATSYTSTVTIHPATLTLIAPKKSNLNSLVSIELLGSIKSILTIDLKKSNNFNVKRTRTSTSCKISQGIMTTTYKIVFEVVFTKKGGYIFNQESFIGTPATIEMNEVEIKVK